MKRLTQLLAPCVLVALFAGCDRTSTQTTPQVVLAGFEAYQNKGANAAFDIWGKGPLETDKTARATVTGALERVEAAYGKVQGHEILRVVKLGSAVRRVYAMVRYERGPVYASFDCYKAGDNWLVTDLLVHTKAALVFPASLLGD